jgi:photosystem II stability/assembly factor-like uncharacterized protein
VGENGLILATTDGGDSWTSAQSGTTEALSGVACPDSVTCYVVGAGTDILGTSNGGRTWQPQATPASARLVGIACPGTRTCVAVGDAGALVTTADGGQTWLRPRVPLQRPLSAVACPDVQRCYAVGPAGVIVATRDGAQTWQDESLSLVMGGARREGGTRWADQHPAREGAQSKTGAGDTPTLTDVACPAVDICAASGGQMVITTDGGHSWEVQPVQSGQGGVSFWSDGIACPNQATCTAVGTAGTIMVGSPAARPWSLQKSGTVVDLHGIACPSLDVCYAVGDGETIVAQGTRVPAAATSGGRRTGPSMATTVPLSR